MGFAPTWLHQVSPLLHKTTLTTSSIVSSSSVLPVVDGLLIDMSRVWLTVQPVPRAVHWCAIV